MSHRALLLLLLVVAACAPEVEVSGERPQATERCQEAEFQQVTILELGGIVVTYRDIDAAQLRPLMELAGTELAGTVAVTSYDRIEHGQVVLAAWGVLQRCDGVDLDALRTFVDAYAKQAGPSEEPH